MRTPSKTRPSTHAAYTERINLAIDYIFTHLDQPLHLKHIARAAMLSPFHFHRIFQALVGETLNDFIKRQRLERALTLMAFTPRTPEAPDSPRTRRPVKPSLTKIALSSGFNSPSDFSRSFKQHFGTCPSTFDIKSWRETHRARLEAKLPGASNSPNPAKHLHLTRLPPRSNPDNFTVRIREIPKRTVAYIRVLNPYKGDAVFKAVHRLIDWAKANNCADNQWLGYQRENPEITALEDCQYHIAVEADRFTPTGEIGRFTFPNMLVAEIEIKGPIDLELRALQYFFTNWLPRSRYIPDDHPAFESWIGQPFAHGTNYFELNAQLPVKRA